jgi:sugar lactone lactonase YvrE
VRPADYRAEVLAAGFLFLEGPRWHGGRLYVSDFFDRVVRSFAPDGSYQVECEVPGQPSGLGFLPSGELLVASMRDRHILVAGPDGLASYADLSSECAYQLNDMLVDEAGGLYVGSFGYEPGAEPVLASSLMRVSTSRQVSVAAPDLVFPNGMTRLPGGRVLLVAESYAARVSAFDIGADGRLDGRRVWASFAPGGPAAAPAELIAGGAVLPDGICADAEGALWVANANGPGVLRVAEGGGVLAVVDTGDLAGYAVALGGPAGSTLFICAAGPLGSYDARTVRRSCLLHVQVAVPAAG